MPFLSASTRHARWVLGVLLLVLGLGESGCQSAKPFFSFAPGTGSYALSSQAAAPTSRPDSVSGPAKTMAPAAVASAVQPVGRLEPRRHPRPAASPQRAFPRRSAAAQPVAKRAGLADKLPAERGLLLSGAGSVVLGLILTYVGSNASSAGLLGLAHGLLWVGGLLLAGWFVLMLIRASKE